MNLYEQQASNRRKTWLVMLAFVAFFLFLGFGFDAFYIGAGGGVVPVGSVIALGVGSVSAAVSYFSGDRAVLAATAARPLEELDRDRDGRRSPQAARSSRTSSTR